MFVIARITPYERHAPKNGKGHALSLANSFWFTLSAFFFRSTAISPKVIITEKYYENQARYNFSRTGGATQKLGGRNIRNDPIFKVYRVKLYGK